MWDKLQFRNVGDSAGEDFVKVLTLEMIHTSPTARRDSEMFHVCRTGLR